MGGDEEEWRCNSQRWLYSVPGRADFVIADRCCYAALMAQSRTVVIIPHYFCYEIIL